MDNNECKLCKKELKDCICGEQKVTEQIEDLDKTTELESAIVDNSIEFEIKKGEGKKYRVRMPTIREKVEINQQRLGEMRKLQVAGFLYEAELRKLLKDKQGIDVSKIESKIVEVDMEIEKTELRLTPEPNKENKEKLKEIIRDLKTERLGYIIEKSNYLEPSIEAQLSELMTAHFTSLIFEKKVDDKSIAIKEGDKYSQKWVRVFKSYNEFIDSTDTSLVNVGISYTCTLLF